MEQQAVNQPGAISPGSLHQAFFKPEKEEPRNRSRVRVKIKNRNCAGLQVLTRLVGPGEHIVDCYDDEVSKIAGMVEDPALIAAAQRQFEKDLAEEVAKNIEGWQGSVDEVIALMASGADEKVNEAYALVLKTTPQSVQATFTHLNKRGMRPLDHAELIAGSEQPEPQRAAMQQATKTQAEALAGALRIVAKELITELKAGATNDELDARVEAKVKELLGESKAATKGR